MRTLAAALAVAVLLLISRVQAGNIVLYGDSHFKNGIFKIVPVTPDMCYNLKCDKNDMTLSATWDDLPKDSFILFFREYDCQGEMRHWNTTEKKFPTNFGLDYFDTAISSLRVIVRGPGHQLGPFDICYGNVL